MSMEKYDGSTNKGNVHCAWCGRLTWEGRANNQAGHCVECYDLMGKEIEASDSGNEVLAQKYEAELNKRRKGASE